MRLGNPEIKNKTTYEEKNGKEQWNWIVMYLYKKTL